MRKNDHQRLIKRETDVQVASSVGSQPRFLGNSVTDVLSDLQEAYNHWITTSGGGGNIAQGVPDRFSTAEHLLYDDYQIIGERII